MELTQKMLEYFGGDPKRIQHFIKVHAFSVIIGKGEKLTAEELHTLESAALVHDIGIKPAERLYGECGGKLQEKLGPAEAEKILRELDYSAEEIERICFMVGHHHTYDNVNDKLLQILIEADFIVNLYEDGVSDEGIKTAYTKIFRTDSGKALARTIFGIEV